MLRCLVFATQHNILFLERRVTLSFADVSLLLWKKNIIDENMHMQHLAGFHLCFCNIYWNHFWELFNIFHISPNSTPRFKELPISKYSFLPLCLLKKAPFKYVDLSFYCLTQKENIVTLFALMLFWIFWGRCLMKAIKRLLNLFFLRFSQSSWLDNRII